MRAILCGLLLVGLAATLPMALGGRIESVVLVGLGWAGTDARLPSGEALARAPAGATTTLLSPGRVEWRLPGDATASLATAANALGHQRPAGAACPADAACPLDLLTSQPPFAEDAGPVDPPALTVSPAPRWAWLAAMALGMAGAALVVLGLARSPPPSPLLRRRLVPAVALTGALLGAAAGAGLGGAMEQMVLVKPLQRPRLPWEPITRDPLMRTHDVAARLGSPGFLTGLDVEVHTIPLGRAVVTHVRARSGQAVAALLMRIRERVVEPDARDEAVLRALLTSWKVPPGQEVERDRILAELMAPGIVELGIEGDDRGPWKGGLAGGLAGGLVAFAAAGRRRR